MKHFISFYFFGITIDFDGSVAISILSAGVFFLWYNICMEEIMEKEKNGLSKYINEALGIEDEMCRNVYGDFLERGKWPAMMPEKDFQNVRALLERLIGDTEKHRQIILKLK